MKAKKNEKAEQVPPPPAFTASSDNDEGRVGEGR